MSYDAEHWVATLVVGRSSLKFLLKEMARLADEYGRCYPSTEYLVGQTEQDRKTVLAGIDELVARGFIRDTGNRTGRTKQVRIFQLQIPDEFVAKLRARNSPENGTVIPSDAPKSLSGQGDSAGNTSNSPENGTLPGERVPKTASKGPVFPRKGPKNGTRNPQESSGKGESARTRESAEETGPDPVPNWREVEGVNADALLSWSAYRHAKGQSLTDHELHATALELVRFGDAAEQARIVRACTAGGFRMLRFVQPHARAGAEPDEWREQQLQASRDRAREHLRTLNARADRVGYRRLTSSDREVVWLAGLVEAEKRAARQEISA